MRGAETVRLPSDRPPGWLLVVALFPVAILLYYVLPGGAVHDVGYDAFGVAATILIARRALRAPAERPAWLLLLIALSAWTLGDVLWSIEHMLDPAKDTFEVADLLYVAGYVPLGLAVLRRSRRQLRLATLVDTSILTAAAAIGMWLILVSPQLGVAAADHRDVAAAGAYALGDLFLVAVAIRVVLGSDRVPAPYVAVLAGLLAVLVSDTLFVPIADAYRPGTLLDIGWIAGYSLFAIAAVLPADLRLPLTARWPSAGARASATPGRSAPAAGDRRRTIPLVLLLAAVLFGPVMLGILAVGHAPIRDIVVVTALTAVLITLTVARLQETIRQLRSANAVAVAEAEARQLAESGLRDERQRLRLLLDQLPAVVFALDPDLRIISMRGHDLPPEEELIGVPIRTFLEALDPAWVGNGTERRALDGESVRMEVTWAGRVFEVALEPFRAADGEALGIVGIGIDVTTARQLEAQLERARRMEALGLLAGGIAHDFNNLLTAISGYGELVRDSLPVDDPARADADTIVKVSDRAAQLTQQLLAYSRSQVLRPEIVCPNTIVERIVPLLRRIIAADIEVVAETAADPWPISVDPGQLDQIILNLAVNARDAMPGSGTLTISAANVEIDEVWPGAWDGFDAKPGRFVRVRVSDTGVGMTADTKARIFEPFFTTKAVGHGTGLGLAMVYGVVRQSGGFVRVESTPGAGSTFDVFLPVAEAAASTGDALPVRASPEASTAATILVAEDEPTIARLVEAILGRGGYRAIVCGSGYEALRWLAGRAADAPADGPAGSRRGGQAAPSDPTAVACLVTDVLMPGMKGPELAARAREVHPGLPVAFISGYAGLDALPALDERTMFLPKPFTASDLLAMVERLTRPAQSPVSTPVAAALEAWSAP